MIRKTIAGKLKSNSGASLSIALLLFLVCAVLGSVILRSGTAASGRVADMAKADARYYSVTSAADYLADAITRVGDDKRIVTVTRTAETRTTETSSYNGESWSNPSKTSEYTTYSSPVIKDNSSTGSGNAETILTRAVQDIFFGGTIVDAEGCWSKDKPSIKAADGSAGTENYDFSLQFTRGSNADEDLTVYVDETIRQNGDIELTVSNVEDKAAEGYRVQMLFVLTSKTNSNSTTRTSSATSGTAEEGNLVLTETARTTETKTTTCYWTLAEIRKVN